jgi:hypothetical protein
MKRSFILFAFLLVLSSTYAMDPVKTTALPLKASSIMIPVGSNGQSMSLEQLAHIKPREFARLTNKNMNFFERAGFTLAQKKLRNNIKADGTINNKKLDKLVAALDGETGFHVGGFALGFLLGLIGILIAYLINDDYKSNRRKWAWIGFGSFLVIYLILFAVFA